MTTRVASGRRAFCGSLGALLTIATLTASLATAGTRAHELLGANELDRLPDELRRAVDQARDAIEHEAWEKLYAISSPEATGSSEAAFVSNARQIARVTGQVSGTTFLEAHLFDPATNDTPSPDGLFHTAAVPSHVFPDGIQLGVPFKKSHVVLLGETQSELDQPLWVTLLLAETAGEWQVVAWHFNPRKSNGHDGYWYEARAEAFETAGQFRNAYLYRILARQLLVPSPYLVTKAARSVNDALTENVPPNLPYPMVRPAESWPISETESVEVHLVMPVAIGVSFGVEVRFRSEIAELDSEAARQERKRLFDYVAREFPEYRDGFEGVYVAATLSNGRGFRDFFPYE